MKNKLQKPDAPWRYFDDCHICCAMKEANRQGKGLSANELKKAFQMQKKRKSR